MGSISGVFSDPNYTGMKILDQPWLLLAAPPWAGWRRGRPWLLPALAGAGAAPGPSLAWLAQGPPLAVCISGNSLRPGLWGLVLGAFQAWGLRPGAWGPRPGADLV